MSALDWAGLTSEAESALWAIAKECPLPGALADKGCLASGEAGLAVFFAHLARAHPGSRWRDRALAHLKHAHRVLADLALPPGLFDGFLGIGWAHAHVGRVLGEWGETDDLVEMDRLITGLQERNTLLPMDLISGIAGFGVYGLHRMATGGTCGPLVASLLALEKTAVRTPAGTAWLTRAEWLPTHQRLVVSGDMQN